MKLSPRATASARIPLLARTGIPLAFALLMTGCVRRQLTVTSQPSGALVYLNDREAGRTPFTTDFLWYGKYDVVVRKEGYETIVSRKQINSPWWGVPPVDLIAELMPWHPTDLHKLNFTLTEKHADAPAAGIIARGLAMKHQMPSTMPATAPTTYVGQ